MEIKTNTTEEITFDIEGAEGTATVENSKVVSVSIKLAGTHGGNQIQALDEKFLRDVYKAIGDLLRHVDANRDVGHRNLDLMTKGELFSAIKDVGMQESLQKEAKINDYTRV